MIRETSTLERLRHENAELRARLEEAEDLLRAIRCGEVDALVMTGADGEQEEVFTLRSADHPYRVLVETMQEGTATVLAGGGIDIYYVNRRLATMLGLPAERIIGQSLVRFVEPADLPQLHDLVSRARAGEARAELHLRAADGNSVPALVSGAAMPVNGIETLCLVITDLSTEKRQEELLQRKRQEYEVLRQTENALRASEERLREADRRKDEFLAMLAHELRNPLAPISNAVSLLQRLGPDEEPVRQAREMIARQVRHLSRLVDDLLDVARITRGKVRLRTEVIELAPIILSAVDAARPLFESRRQRLRVELPDTPVYLMADPTRLTQVIGNVLSNAGKYSNDDGEVVLRLQCEGRAVELSVRDTGIGMDPEILQRVFEPFSQADRSLDRSQGGLGIGLTLVKHLVELHKGEVEARSDGVGLGSEFLIRLPITSDMGRPIEASDDLAPSSQLPQRRILVVDDNVDVADSLAFLLRLEGHTVALASSGPAALDVAAAFIPDVALIDIGLPGMDGFEVARRLRARPEWQRTVLAALTGYAQSDDHQRSQEAGFDHHLVKPVEPAALLQFVASATRHSSPNPAPYAPR